MRKIKKCLSKMEKYFICNVLFYISLDSYIAKYQNWLKRNGMNITGDIKYINPDVYFDGKDYSYIKIGDNVTISREVMVLCHDYSVTNAIGVLHEKVIKRHEGEMFYLKKVEIGDNSFIGARASLLPGTVIGKNCIIGACSVVKGIIPDNSVCVGNPCKIIGLTTDYALKVEKQNDFFVE